MTAGGRKLSPATRPLLSARDRLILIRPFLKLNDRMNELLADKDRLKINVRIVYGESELAPAEIEWLKALTYVRTSFCRNLHAKCYLSESACIVTSLSLYEFSMVNNNEMGVLIDRLQDRITLERVERKADIPATLEPKLDAPRATIEAPPSAALTGTKQYEKITTAKIAAKLGMTTKAFQERLVELGMLELRDGGRHYLGDAGKDAGGKWRPGPGGGYMLWPEGFTLPAS
jgi:hypothetical protein